MHIRVGFDMGFDSPQPTPMIFNLNVHYTRVSDLVSRNNLRFDPPVPISGYRDGFGNWCTRIVAPPGQIWISSDALVNDSGLPDAYVPDALEVPVADLPEDTLVYLLGSRYCETDRLSQTAWDLFGHGSNRNSRSVRRSRPPRAFNAMGHQHQVPKPAGVICLTIPGGADSWIHNEAHGRKASRR